VEAYARLVQISDPHLSADNLATVANLKVALVPCETVARTAEVTTTLTTDD
jgi:hypothetical protein